MPARIHRSASHQSRAFQGDTTENTWGATDSRLGENAARRNTGVLQGMVRSVQPVQADHRVGKDD